jgi:hypothetical protein
MEGGETGVRPATPESSSCTPVLVRPHGEPSTQPHNTHSRTTHNRTRHSIWIMCRICHWQTAHTGALIDTSGAPTDHHQMPFLLNLTLSLQHSLTLSHCSTLSLSLTAALSLSHCSTLTLSLQHSLTLSLQHSLSHTALSLSHCSTLKDPLQRSHCPYCVTPTVLLIPSHSCCRTLTHPLPLSVVLHPP